MLCSLSQHSVSQAIDTIADSTTLHEFMRELWFCVLYALKFA